MNACSRRPAERLLAPPGPLLVLLDLTLLFKGGGAFLCYIIKHNSKTICVWPLKICKVEVISETFIKRKCSLNFLKSKQPNSE